MDSAYGYDMDNALGYQIGHAATRLKIVLRRLFAQAGLDITPEQWVVLFRLHERQGLTQGELGDRTVKDKTTITRILDRLEKKGLVERRRSERDRRSQCIFLTASGAASLDTLMPLVQAFASEAFADIGPEDRDQLRRILGRIESRLDTMLETRDSL